MAITVTKELELISKFYSESTPHETLFPQQEAKVVLPFSDAWFERGRVYGFGPKFVKIGSRVFYQKIDLLNFINKHKSMSSTSEKQEGDDNAV
jgi:hypothetical protein